MRTLLKKIPGLAWLVRSGRALHEIAVRRFLSSTLRWARKTPWRRSLLFEEWPGQHVLAEHSRESYLVDTGDSVIGRILYFRGDFDFGKFEKACEIIRETGALAAGQEPPVLLDVGANIGSICIPAVKRGLASRCLAFEPEAGNIRLLGINALLNAVDHVIEVHQVAVGDRNGSVTIRRSSSNHGDHRVSAGDGDGADDVAMVPLNDFADNLDLSNAILWMDIQGFEGFALKGASRFCEKGVPLVLEYCKEDLESAGSYDILLSVLSSSVYSSFYDLGEDAPVRRTLTTEALIDLGIALERRGTFTDILVLAS